MLLFDVILSGKTLIGDIYEPGSEYTGYNGTVMTGRKFLHASVS